MRLRPIVATSALALVAACATAPAVSVQVTAPSPSPNPTPSTTASPVPTPTPATPASATPSPTLSSPGPASADAGGFSYEVNAIPAPVVEPSPPAYRIEVWEVDGVVMGYAGHQVVISDDDDARAARFYQKYGAHQLNREVITDSGGQKHLYPMRVAWVPTPDVVDLTELPDLARRAGVTGHYRFHTWSGAALFQTWLRMKLDADFPVQPWLNGVSDGGAEAGRYGTGQACLDSLADVPQRAVKGLVSAAWQERDLTLTVVADVPLPQRSRPAVYGCGTLVGNHLELRMFYVEDAPVGISLCPQELPVVIKDVPPGAYDVVDAVSGTTLAKIDASEPGRSFGYVRPRCPS